MYYWKSITRWAFNLKKQVLIVYFAARNIATPMYLKILAIIVAAYALSPIDLIPDFIPIIGYLDDIIIVPLGIMAVLRFLPSPILISAEQQAAQVIQKPKSNITAAIFILIWIITSVLIIYLLKNSNIG